jgi:hypothetical protein
MEELGEDKSEMIQGFLEKNTWNIKSWKFQAEKHLKFLEENPSLEDRKKAEDLFRKHPSWDNQLFDEDVDNYVIAKLAAVWASIKKDRDGARKLFGLVTYLPDEFFERMEEELVPLAEKCRELHWGATQETFPEWKDVSRQYAEKLIEFMNWELEIYDSMPKETLEELAAKDLGDR